ncbi:DUF4229 domain-containing protein [Nocardioides sp. SYSU D00038]|uniref:DUF4229 domain-containing protein n=1 Tax=Nocardioides sp. SYSU D00038 TaxID=2812554 RepID=UPI001967A0C1|nr:DUF4229 domain-containing protein [Nocardioides sp. SYSU D00038]
MKPFVVYTALRLLLLVGTFAIVGGVWLLVADEVQVLPAIVISFVVSGLLSYVWLQRPRQEFAQRVEQRAQRATRAFEEMKSREDADDDPPVNPGR